VKLSATEGRAFIDFMRNSVPSKPLVSASVIALKAGRARKSLELAMMESVKYIIRFGE
jgi:hypothetical protein